MILHVRFGFVDHLFGWFSCGVQHLSFESHELQLGATLLHEVVHEMEGDAAHHAELGGTQRILHVAPVVVVEQIELLLWWKLFCHVEIHVFAVDEEAHAAWTAPPRTADHAERAASHVLVERHVQQHLAVVHVTAHVHVTVDARFPVAQEILRRTSRSVQARHVRQVHGFVQRPHLGAFVRLAIVVVRATSATFRRRHGVSAALEQHHCTQHKASMHTTQSIDAHNSLHHCIEQHHCTQHKASMHTTACTIAQCMAPMQTSPAIAACRHSTTVYIYIELRAGVPCAASVQATPDHATAPCATPHHRVPPWVTQPFAKLGDGSNWVVQCGSSETRSNSNSVDKDHLNGGFQCLRYASTYSAASAEPLNSCRRRWPRAQAWETCRGSRQACMCS